MILPVPKLSPKARVLTALHVAAYLSLALGVVWLAALCYRGRVVRTSGAVRAHQIDVDSLLKDSKAAHDALERTRHLAATLDSTARTARAGERTARHDADRARDSADHLARLLVARDRLLARAQAQAHARVPAPGSVPGDARPSVTVRVIAPLPPVADSLALVQHEVDSGGVTWEALYYRRTEEAMALRTALFHADADTAMLTAEVALLRASLDEHAAREARLEHALAVEVKQNRCRVLWLPCPSRTAMAIGGAIIGLGAGIAAAHH